ncbi:MAG: ABC transporter permease [Bryobacteraceae bacterium]|nr:ABC transporter permease [Bryobacteraceae bacterium]
MRSIRVFEALLRCFPGPFRREYGDEMVRTFSQEIRGARERGSRREQWAVWLRSAAGIFQTAPQEHLHVIRQDVRYAVRTLTAQPGFTAVAVLSLALGIGANVAIFSIVNSLLLGMLPVRNPEELVMLTDPGARGMWTGVTTGDRELMTYAEFAQLRDEAGAFSALMASQSGLSRLQVRVNGGEAEEVQGRMVSAEYFDTLGAPAMLGRTYRDTDGAKPAVAVISHAFWQRRFGGRPEALGARIALRKTVFTVIGVMPPPFFGETVGDRPDVWLPLAMQPEIAPGRDLLHDDPSRLQKTAWLHVFGRLKPGVHSAEAETASNTVFQRGLAAFYSGAATEEVRRNFMNQRLRVRAAVSGASGIRDDFGGPLTLMLAAAGVVFLIACANLGNLMLARATARTREMAVRQALGAGRGDLVRQWMTEALVIALAGGAAGLAAAWALRAGLLMLVPSTVRLSESADARVLAFAVGLSVLAGLLLGLLPSLRTIRVDAAAGVKEQSRGVTASARWLRTGRWIVAGQVALSLPLLVGAGLLVRTLDNLRRVDVGFEKEKLLMLRVDVESAGYEEPRRQAVFERLHERVRRIPGVQSASYSPHGLFLGGDSGDDVEVEGYTPRDENDRSSRYDQVGPGYFAALGVPMKLGRPITERDHATSPKVCVINEAFAKKFFAGRNPIGLHVTQVFAQQRNRFQVVGVAGNFRKNRLRGEIEHRYFIPSAQPVDVPERVTFVVRTAGDAASAIPALRSAIRAEDPNLPVTAARPLTELLEERMAQDRLVAELSLAFGVTALLLAAIGLYGVLSYGVARRTNEIGIRKAMGARESSVVAMILRESSWLLAGGLGAGFLLAFGSLRWIESLLFGLAPSDPLAYAIAILLLGGVGLAASWAPARRAARVDPLVAIRYE